MGLKAYCYKDGSIALSHQAPAVAICFAEGNRDELLIFLRGVAKGNFAGVLHVPDVKGRYPDQDCVALKKWTERLAVKLDEYQKTGLFKSIKVSL